MSLGLTFTLFGCGAGETIVEETTPPIEEVEEVDISESQTVEEEVSSSQTEEGESAYSEDDYTYIETDGGSTSGYREPLVKTNIGFGDRDYYAYTNEYGQLVRVTAKEIILQDDDNEPVKSNGRYYWKMADVPGTELPDMDRGHIIADSLGGVSNAYNITPQDATLNRHGDQAYMERVIRDAGGATDFEAIITYPNNETHIPSHYQYTYTVNGHTVVDKFENLNPDELNKALEAEGKLESQQPVANENKVEESVNNASSNKGEYVDENGNGLIKGSSSGIYHTPESPYYSRTTSPKEMFKTIKEAEDAGYRAPK